MIEVNGVLVFRSDCLICFGLEWRLSFELCFVRGCSCWFSKISCEWLEKLSLFSLLERVFNVKLVFMICLLLNEWCDKVNL